MKKSFLLLTVLILIVSLTLSSCSDEILKKTGQAMKSFAGMEREYSDEEIEQQTTAVKKKANIISTISSDTDLRSTDTDAKAIIKDLIDSIIDNPACDMKQKTSVEVEMLNKLVEANSPLTHYSSGTNSGDIKQAIEDNKEKLNALGPGISDTLTGILDVFTTKTNSGFINSTSETASAQEVAAAASAALMGSAINNLVDTLVNNQPDNQQELISTCLDLISEFDDAANSYMAVTGKTGLSIMDSINIKDFGSMAEKLQNEGGND